MLPSAPSLHSLIPSWPSLHSFLLEPSSSYQNPALAQSCRKLRDLTARGCRVRLTQARGRDELDAITGVSTGQPAREQEAGALRLGGWRLPVLGTLKLKPCCCLMSGSRCGGRGVPGQDEEDAACLGRGL